MVIMPTGRPVSQWTLTEHPPCAGWFRRPGTSCEVVTPHAAAISLHNRHWQVHPGPVLSGPVSSPGHSRTVAPKAKETLQGRREEWSRVGVPFPSTFQLLVNQGGFLSPKPRLRCHPGLGPASGQKSHSPKMLERSLRPQRGILTNHDV